MKMPVRGDLHGQEMGDNILPLCTTPDTQSLSDKRIYLIRWMEFIFGGWSKILVSFRKGEKKEDLSKAYPHEDVKKFIEKLKDGRLADLTQDSQNRIIDELAGRNLI